MRNCARVSRLEQHSQDNAPGQDKGGDSEQPYGPVAGSAFDERSTARAVLPDPAHDGVLPLEAHSESAHAPASGRVRSGPQSVDGAARRFRRAAWNGKLGRQGPYGGMRRPVKRWSTCSNPAVHCGSSGRVVREG